MLKILSLFQVVVVLIGGCAGPQKSSSGWVTLEQAKSISCESWPKPTKVIGIEEVVTLKGLRPGFLSQLRMRHGGTGRAFVEFSGDEEIKPEELQARRFGAGASVAGGGDVGGKLHVALIQKTGSAAKLEIRSLKDNVIRHSLRLDDKDILAARAHFVKDGMWVLLSVGDSENVGAEDAPIRILYVDFKASARKGAQPKVVKIGDRKLPSNVQLVALGSGEEALLITLTKKGSAANAVAFHLSYASAVSGKLGEPRQLDIKSEAGVESWRVVAERNGFLLGFVDGDSLVGQADLRIAKIHWQDDYEKLVWNKAFSLTNEHVSEPLWVKGGDQMYLLLPKWVDNESTIVAYGVSEIGASAGKPLGVLANGVRVMDAFYWQDKGDIFAIVRYRNGNSRQFELCNLGNP